MNAYILWVSFLFQILFTIWTTRHTQSRSCPRISSNVPIIVFTVFPLVFESIIYFVPVKMDTERTGKHTIIITAIILYFIAQTIKSLKWCKVTERKVETQKNFIVICWNARITNSSYFLYHFSHYLKGWSSGNRSGMVTRFLCCRNVAQPLPFLCANFIDSEFSLETCR